MTLPSKSVSFFLSKTDVVIRTLHRTVLGIERDLAGRTLGVETSHIVGKQ